MILPALPASMRLAVGLLAALLGLSALATIGFAAMTAPRQAWALLGFEGVTLLAAAFGLLVWRGRFSDAPGLAIACVAGAALSTSVLGYLGANGAIGEVRLREWLGARLAGALLLALLACAAVLRRSPGQWLVALRGSFYLLTAAGFTLLLMLYDGRLRPAGSGVRLAAHQAFVAASLLGLAGCAALMPLTLLSRAESDIPKWMRLLGQFLIVAVAVALIALTGGNLGQTLEGAREAARIALLVALSVVLIGALCAGTQLVVGAFAACVASGDSDESGSTPSAVAGVTPTPGATSS